MSATTRVRPDLHLHLSRSIPLYYSLALAFEDAIRDGQLAVGDVLEPASSLQERLHWSPRTIRHAFRLLEERGVVRRTARSMFTVVACPN